MFGDSRNFTLINPISDSCLNDGFTGVFHPMLVPAADLEAIGGELIGSGDPRPAPFDKLRYGYCPQYCGMRFSIHRGRNMVVTCALANEEKAGQNVWQRLVETCCHFRDGWPEVLSDPGNSDVDVDDPKNAHFYLKRGCPDLIGSGIEITRPTKLPFLATMIAPPWHRGGDRNMLELAYRLRNAVAVLILKSEWFEDEQIKTASFGYEAACRSICRWRAGPVNLVPRKTRITSRKRWDYSP